jgi:tetratricopeptide (TPR) repeat protein
MKIAVYAISKNEEHFVKRFCESCTDADMVIICDTGSTDNTAQVARDCGAIVHDIRVKPWRFDIARNIALGLVPEDVDICVSIDLDEVMVPGWRKIVEDAWEKDTTRLSYLYDWSNNLIFNTSKIHSRFGFVWNYPCHEYVESDPRAPEKYAFTTELLVKHYPDPTKSRGNYMQLLECAVKEDPYCQRNAFYYARELNFNSRWVEAEQAWKKCLSWAERYTDYEQDYIRRKLAQCLEGQDRLSEAHKQYREASAVYPHGRDAWVDLADFCHKQGLWVECQYAARQALFINNRTTLYTNDPVSWGPKPYDLAALSSYYIGDFKQAMEYGAKAIELDPNDKRLQDNLDFYRKALQPEQTDTIKLFS